jgi:hypothetical protein
MINVQSTHQSCVTLTQVSDTDERHRGRKLRFQDVDEVFDAFLAVIDSVQERSPHSDRCGAEAHAFENVGTAAYTTVDEDLEF